MRHKVRTVVCLTMYNYVISMNKIKDKTRMSNYFCIMSHAIDNATSASRMKSEQHNQIENSNTRKVAIVK